MSTNTFLLFYLKYILHFRLGVIMELNWGRTREFMRGMARKLANPDAAEDDPLVGTQIRLDKTTYTVQSKIGQGKPF